MNVNIKAFSILMVAGISVAWSPISQPAVHDPRCSVSQPVKAVTKCSAYRYQYNKINNLCQPVCCSSAPFSTFMECSQTCRSMEVCFTHRPRSSCASRTVTVYYFSTAKDACIAEPGCTYRGNNFPTLGECQKTCRTKTTGPSQAVPGVPDTTIASHPGNGGGSSFPQLITPFPVNKPAPPQQGAGMPSSNHQQGIQGQITSGMIRLPGQQQWIPSPTAPNSHQRPGAPGSSFPFQSNSGGVPPFSQQVPQLPATRPLTPLRSGGTPSSNHQQGTLGQISSGTMVSPAHQPSNTNPAGSTTSHQRPQQSWNGILPPLNTYTQSPGGGPQFPQQSGQKPWNGPGTSQQLSLNKSNHGIVQNTFANQHSTGILPVSDQRLGVQSWRGHMGSQIPQQGAQQQWSNGVLSPNTSHIALLPAGSGGISTSQQPQWGSPGGTSHIPQPGQQQQWGSANVSQNVQQYPSTEMTSNSQQGPHWSWGSGASAGGQPHSTAAQQANGAGPVLRNPSTQPPWTGQAATESTQGVQQGQSTSWRGGILPGSQPNAVAQRTHLSNLPNPSHSTQLSLNTQPPPQPGNVRVTSAGSQQNAQQQQNIRLPSQFLTSFLTSNPSAVSKLSIQRRVVSVQQQTVRRSLRHQTVST